MSDAMTEVLRAMESDDPEELERIIAAKRPEHLQALLEIAADGARFTPDQRRKALYALGRWGDPSVVAEIRRVLPELNEVQRIAAIDALGRLGTAEALEAVAVYAADPSPWIRETVIIALQRIGGLESLNVLRRMAAAEPVEWVRRRAEASLERLSG
jgi:HEAT repeat protein